MRQIKFRAWNTQAGMWQTEWSALGMNGEKLVKLPNGEFVESKEVALTFQQFTGLLDRNSKEIYEGDIFNCHYSEETKHHHKWKVVWSDEDAGFRLQRIGEPCNQSMVTQRVSDYSGWRGEVIGNIYENPELLSN